MKDYPHLIKDLTRIYHLDFIAILEIGISDAKAESVVRKIGLDEKVIVEAQGFFGGIWWVWRNNFPPIYVISSSRFCVNLKVNYASFSFWYFSIIYVSPQPGGRHGLWNELRAFSSSIPGSWCIIGDFNIVLYE